MFTNSPIFSRIRSTSRVAGGPWWLLMAPGVALIVMALAIMIWPQLLAYLVAAALLFAGVSLTAWGWSMRQIGKQVQHRESTVYYEVR